MISNDVKSIFNAWNINTKFLTIVSFIVSEFLLKYAIIECKLIIGLQRIVCLKIDGKFIGIAEFQFHSKSRKNMAIRWSYENVLSIFDKNFTITELNEKKWNILITTR